MGFKKRKRQEETETHVEVVRTDVVKSSFPGRLKEKRLREHIETWVDHVSKIANKGSLFLNRLLIYCFENNVSDQDFPDLLDMKTYRHCFLADRKATQSMSPVFRTVWNRVFRDFPVTEKIVGDSRAIDNAVVQYMTATKKYFAENLSKKINAWVRHWMEDNGIDDKHFRAISCEIKGAKCKTQPPDEAKQFIRFQRSLLMSPKDGANKKWIYENFKVVVKYFWRFAKYMEEFEDTRRYNVAPVARIGSRHLKIDVFVLYHLLKNAGLVAGNLKDFREQKDAQFHSVFKLTGLSSSDFAYVVETDGVAISVHFEKKIWVKKPETEGNEEQSEDATELESEETEGETVIDAEDLVAETEDSVDEMEVDADPERVIAIDPGRANLIQAVVDEEDGTRKFFKLKRKAYYRWSGMTQHSKVIEELRKLNLEIEIAEALYAKVSFKTTVSESWDEALKTYISIYNQLWSVRTHKKWLRSKFRVYCLKKKTLDRFFHQMDLKGSNTIVAYGGAHFSPTGRGEKPAPTTALKRACRRHFRTVKINEDYTSQVCPHCEQLLGEVIEMKEDGSKFRLRGLRRCWSTVCSQNFLLSRDKIAALNIKRCYEAGSLKNRPRSLQRDQWRGVTKPPVTLIKFTKTEARQPLLRRVSVVQA